jgi:chemotaxis response regulator CheB
VDRVTVLVIENNAAEAALVAAALALRPDVQVLDAPDEGEAARRLESPRCPVVLALAGAAALAAPPAALFKRLGAQGIPVIGIAAGLSDADKGRALAAGVSEVHDRPDQWRPYAALIESLAGRFIQKG